MAKFENTAQHVAGGYKGAINSVSLSATRPRRRLLILIFAYRNRTKFQIKPKLKLLGSFLTCQNGVSNSRIKVKEALVLKDGSKDEHVKVLRKEEKQA